MKLSSETRNALRTGKTIFAAQNAVLVVRKQEPVAPSLVVAFLNSRRDRDPR